MFFIQHISSAAPHFLLRRWNRNRSRVCIDTLAVSHDNHSALSDPHIFVSTIPHWPLPTVRDLTRDGRWSTYDVSVLKMAKVSFREKCARMGITLKIPSPTKLARLGHFPPASLAGPMFYADVFSQSWNF
jgi:hypothetical protein